MGRRLADQFPIWPAAHAAGLQNTREIWADAQLKRKMDRAVQARHLGVEDVLAADGNDEVPGDINIKGDEVNQHYHYYGRPTESGATAATTTNTVAAPAATPAPVQQPATSTTSTVSTVRERVRGGIRSFVIPALIGAALPMAGAAGMALYHYMTDRPDSVSITQPAGQSQFEYRYGIEQRPTPSQ